MSANKKNDMEINKNIYTTNLSFNNTVSFDEDVQNNKFWKDY